MNKPTVGLVGLDSTAGGEVAAGPAIEAVRAALSDAAAETVTCDIERVAAADFAVVAGRVGANGFERANDVAREGGTPWLAVEIGGVGSRSLGGVEAAVSGFAPATACYECLRTRVAANLEDDEGTEDRGESGPDAATARFTGALAGREAVTLLSGGESSVLGGVFEVPHAERTLLPVPGCEECGGERVRDPTLDREYADVDLETAVARAERAADERVGVVSSVGEVESFPAPYYLAELGDTTAFSDAQAAEQAAGVAADWNEAFMKALGEALERYSAGVYRTSEFRTAREADLDSAVAPDEFVLPERWSDAAPGEHTDSADGERLAWAEGQNLATGDATHLPAEFVHFPPPEARHKPSITTGLGLGSSTVEALLSGLYEVIERDATILAWYSSFDPLGLAVDSERFETLTKRARAENLSVTPLLVTQDVDVPVVAVAVHREEGWPRFAVGSGADLDPDAAAASALSEALQNWMELRSMGREDAPDADGAIGRYADFPDPAREFVATETTIPGDSVGPTDPPEGVAELDAVVDRLGDADLSAYAARVTTRDVDQCGFEAVRVLVPEAQPLFTDDPYFGERAREVPAELGFEFRPDRDHHPYP